MTEEARGSVRACAESQGGDRAGHSQGDQGMGSVQERGWRAWRGEWGASELGW